MICSFCDRKAVYYAKHFGKAFCAIHLEDFLIKKLKREIYKEKLVKPFEKFLFVSNYSPASEAALYLFRKVTRRFPIEVYAISLNKFSGVKEWKGEKFSKVIDPVTLEGETKRIIMALSHGRIYSGGYFLFHVIKPFRAFNQKELSVLALLKKFKFYEPKTKDFLVRYVGEALELNLLRSYDLIWDLLHQQKNRKQLGGKIQQI